MNYLYLYLIASMEDVYAMTRLQNVSLRILGVHGPDPRGLRDAVASFNDRYNDESGNALVLDIGEYEVDVGSYGRALVRRRRARMSSTATGSLTGGAGLANLAGV